MHSPADVLRHLLIDLGHGLLPSSTPWPVFASAEPSSPDECITVYDVTGRTQGRSMIDGELFGNFGVQVRIRSKDHVTGWEKAYDIQTAVAEDVYQDTVEIGGNSYFVQALVRIGDILALGKEPTSKRSLFTINAEIIVKDVTEEIIDGGLNLDEPQLGGGIIYS